MDSEIWTELGDWIDVIGLTLEDLENLSRVWVILSPRMLDILDGFYESRIMSGQKWRMKGIDLDGLKRSQQSYWAALFSGPLDDDYRARARVIAVKHHQFGVTMTDYIASYGWFLNAFEREVEAAVDCVSQRAALMASVRRLVFLDMTIAASAYYVVYLD